jgi:hypothetical protein
VHKSEEVGDELSNQRKVLNDAIYGFSSKTEVVFFTGVFMPLMKSKNYEIWRVARGLRDELLNQPKRSSFDPVSVVPKFKVRLLN